MEYITVVRRDVVCCVERVHVGMCAVLRGRTHLTAHKKRRYSIASFTENSRGNPKPGIRGLLSRSFLCLLHLCCLQLSVPFSSCLPPFFASTTPSVIINPQIHMLCSTTNRRASLGPCPTPCPIICGRGAGGGTLGRVANEIPSTALALYRCLL